jgi:hypothetical protein
MEKGKLLGVGYLEILTSLKRLSVYLYLWHLAL